MHVVNWRFVLLDKLAGRTRLEFVHLQGIRMFDVLHDLLFRVMLEAVSVSAPVWVAKEVAKEVEEEEEVKGVEVIGFHRVGGRWERTLVTAQAQD
jgi:hypothetical protein